MPKTPVAIVTLENDRFEYRGYKLMQPTDGWLRFVFDGSEELIPTHRIIHVDAYYEEEE